MSVYEDEKRPEKNVFVFTRLFWRTPIFLNIELELEKILSFLNLSWAYT